MREYGSRGETREREREGEGGRGGRERGEQPPCNDQLSNLFTEMKKGERQKYSERK